LYVTNASIARTVIWGNCNDYGEGFDLAGHAVLTCCDVNLNGINPEGIVFDGPQAYTSPLFCDPTGCGYPPEFDGDYRVRSDSPCLPENSPCGELIGARGRGCDGVPVEEATWGRIKSMYF